MKWLPHRKCSTRRTSRRANRARHQRLGFEPLEERKLLALLGVVPELPLVVYDSSGTVSYNAGTDWFELNATPLVLQETPTSEPRFFEFNGTADFQIHVLVDQLGQATGVPGDDLTLTGEIDLDGDGSIDAAGVLLTGEVGGFGYSDSGGATDYYDFRFTPTGGALAAYFAGKDIGVTTNSENSSFTGSFESDFGGGAKGNIGPITPSAPGIDIEKYVKPLDGQDGGEGLTPGFWKQCQHFDAWTDYEPSDSYEVVFGVDAPGCPTLLDALRAGGGGVYALMRHSTAALLNAAHPNIEYAYTRAEIVTLVQGAFQTGDYETVKDQFELENEKGADLDDAASSTPPGDFGVDADEPTGPVVDLGQAILFTYVVTNPGEVELAGVVVTDDNETPGVPGDDFNPTPVESDGFNVGDGDQDGRLDPGEEWLYTSMATATAGQHVNVGTVIGTPVDEDGNPIGDDVTDQDLAHWLVEQPATASLGDFVWHDLYHGSDHLVDGIQDLGEPGIQGVVVDLLDAELSLLATTTTDADGYYLFDGLDADTYVVQIAASNFASGGLLEGWYATLPNRGGSEALDSDGDLATHRSAPVTLAAGEHNPDVDFGFFVTGIDLVKTGPGSVSVGDTITYHFQVVNTGDVVLHGGAQVYDPMLNPCGDHEIWSGVIQPGQVVELDRTYTTTTCDCGDLVNTAAAVGHPQRPDGVYLSNVTDEDSWTVQVVTPPCGDPSLSGFVYVDKDNDGVKDDNEPGIEGVTIELTGVDDLGALRLTTTTGSDGSYRFGNLRPGTYTVAETQPAGFGDGNDTLGTAGGTAAVDDVFSEIALGEDVDATGYLFGDLEPEVLGDIYISTTSRAVLEDQDGALHYADMTAIGEHGTKLFDHTVLSHPWNWGWTPNLNGFHMLADGSMILSTSRAAEIDGTTFRDGALVRFYGDEFAGRGGDEGKVGTAEVIVTERQLFGTRGLGMDVDAISIASNGDLVVSIAWSKRLADGRSYHRGDLIRLELASDGSLVGSGLFLSHEIFNNGEGANINAAHVIDDTRVAFAVCENRGTTVGDLVFRDGDLVVFDTSTGVATLLFSERTGSEEAEGFKRNEDIDSLFIGDGNGVLRFVDLNP